MGNTKIDNVGQFGQKEMKIADSGQSINFAFCLSILLFLALSFLSQLIGKYSDLALAGFLITMIALGALMTRTFYSFTKNSTGEKRE